jgi:hypothetical protein
MKHDTRYYSQTLPFHVQKWDQTTWLNLVLLGAFYILELGMGDYPYTNYGTKKKKN